MKLLLVDDESFTRDGIVSLTPWKELGINEVVTARDGREGLQTALTFQPDIILTDVRMPHMDGVTMSGCIRKEFPDCVIIFMSGYADKEYLKSAIRLSAINYIEKPFPPTELRATLALAVEKCRERHRTFAAARQMSHHLSLSLPALRSQIACELINPRYAPAEIAEHLRLAYPELDTGGAWITFLIHLFPPADDGENTAGLRDSICDLLDSRLKLSDVAGALVGEKNEQTILVHIQLRNKQQEPLPNSEIGNLCYLLCDILKSTCRFLLATGAPAASLSAIRESYQTASIALQRGFFYKENAVLFYEEKHNHLIYHFGDDALTAFEKSLSHHDAAEADSYIRQLVEKLRRFDGTLVSTVKNFFIQIAELLYQFSLLYGTDTFAADESGETIRALIWDMLFLSDIECYLLARLRAFFAAADEQYRLHPLAYRIRLYVDENYDNDDLSLTELATHFAVSEAYLCTCFKKAFHETITNYIIRKRMDKALKYLQESNKKIKEISALVGYRDCNYFIRLFKKHIGKTPAEYQAEILRK